MGVVGQLDQYLMCRSGAETEEKLHVDGGGVSVVDVGAVRECAQHKFALVGIIFNEVLDDFVEFVHEPFVRTRHKNASQREEFLSRPGSASWHQQSMQPAKCEAQDELMLLPLPIGQKLQPCWGNESDQARGRHH
jgi:hypothetical protein